MSSITMKDEIAKALDSEFEKLAHWLRGHDDDKYEQGPEGKWTTGQHIDHLLKSTKPLNKALRLPKIQLRMMFGKANREGRNYDTLIQRYHEKLALGGQASGRYVPGIPKREDKRQLLATLLKEKDNLLKVVAKWEEQDMDVFILPHPLLGKLTIREMLFFTIYHTGHHAKLLEENY